jgi:hypothetical protein
MAVVLSSTAPERDLYDRVSNIVDISGERPAGLILHAAAQLPSGEVQIFEVWDSEASVSAFTKQRMIPAFTQAGVLDDVQARPRPVHYDLFELVR